MTISERIRPGIEAADWVCVEVGKLEASYAAVQQQLASYIKEDAIKANVNKLLVEQLAACQEELKQANNSLTVVYMSGFRDGSKRNLK
jgi:hypothetical protein